MKYWENEWDWNNIYICTCIVNESMYFTTDMIQAHMTDIAENLLYNDTNSDGTTMVRREIFKFLDS